jgi:hypothetical protein
MILRVSQKLGKKIKAFPTDCLAPDPSPFADWSAHMFWHSHAQYIILTNTASLYSVLMSGAGITNVKKLIGQASSSLRELLILNNASFLYDHHVAPALDNVSISKMGDRHVIGSMNDFIRMTEFYIENRGLSLTEISKHLNDTPMSAIKDGYPKNAFLSLGMQL